MLRGQPIYGGRIPRASDENHPRVPGVPGSGIGDNSYCRVAPAAEEKQSELFSQYIAEIQTILNKLDLQLTPEPPLHDRIKAIMLQYNALVARAAKYD